MFDIGETVTFLSRDDYQVPCVGEVVASGPGTVAIRHEYGVAAVPVDSVLSGRWWPNGRLSPIESASEMRTAIARRRSEQATTTRYDTKKGNAR